jgi:hypothetical protein|tara:strand:+ start:1646 stop:1903 length:258 start_codon:yes stop_codon:yes gene_type:complete
MTDIIHSILAIDPAARVSVNGADEITWHDGNPNGITLDQIAAKQAELVIQAEAYATSKANRLVSVKEKLAALGLTTEEVKDAFGL